ncbi:MAG: DUF4861 domain-containing protein [Tannerellaceae bacterium]|jgi:hypothetical protein|nr:DUF4861 domain-containing protein [Tannerellaceae bacterium]
MKHIFFCTVAALMLLSCGDDSIRISLANPLDFDRTSELTEIEASLIPADFSSKSYILLNDKGAELPWQLSANGALFIFQADVPAKASVVYKLKEGVPAEVIPRTFARFVPERKDDFSWENDMAAYRMYGPALAAENPSNGVDLWLKCTDELITAKLYADELERGISYHENSSGLGLDCYDVKHTAGAGGIAPYTYKLWTGDHYDRFEILENGPLRSVFTLYYDSALVDDEVYSEEITITTEAGSILNKAVVTYSGPKGSVRQAEAPAAKPSKAAPQVLKLAAGITLHDGSGEIFGDSEASVIGYAETAVSTIKKEPQGQNYVGVYMPSSSGEINVEDNHQLILSEYKVGEPLTYYFGGGWSKWKFPTAEDWFAALRQFSLARRQPLIIQITKQD